MDAAELVHGFHRAIAHYFVRPARTREEFSRDPARYWDSPRGYYVAECGENGPSCAREVLIDVDEHGYTPVGGAVIDDDPDFICRECYVSRPVGADDADRIISFGIPHGPI